MYVVPLTQWNTDSGRGRRIFIPMFVVHSKRIKKREWPPQYINLHSAGAPAANAAVCFPPPTRMYLILLLLVAVSTTAAAAASKCRKKRESYESGKVLAAGAAAASTFLSFLPYLWLGWTDNWRGKNRSDRQSWHGMAQEARKKEKEKAPGEKEGESLGTNAIANYVQAVL